MADNIFILEGGYFWKQLPAVTMPQEKDLFGQPVGDSKRTCTRHHGLFVGKRQMGDKYEILLKLVGRVIICDDVLGVHETQPTESQILLQVPKQIYDYPYELGRGYIISTQDVTAL